MSRYRQNPELGYEESSVRGRRWGIAEIWDSNARRAMTGDDIRAPSESKARMQEGRWWGMRSGHRQYLRLRYEEDSGGGQYRGATRI